MEGMMAAGHVYNPQTQTGLEYVEPTEVKANPTNSSSNPKSKADPAPTQPQPQAHPRLRLWQTGELVGEVELAVGTSRWEVWYKLLFCELFPQVTHWWFGSAWTQRVRLSGIAGTLADDSVTGLMQFVSEEQSATPWTVTPGSPVRVYTPLPPFDIHPLNFPLRLRLAQLVLDLIGGEIAADKWLVVTSLVTPPELAYYLPLTSGGKLAGENWQLDDPRLEAGESLREIFCRLQGLRPEQ